MRILSFGEILWDIIDGQEHIGGAPFNMAAHLAHLGEESWIFSALGSDERGRKAKEQIKELGINDKYLQETKDYPSGFVTVDLSAGGEPKYDIHEGVAWDHIEEKTVEEDFDCFYFGTLAQRNQVSKKSLCSVLAQNNFKKVFLDVNLRQNYFSKQTIEQSLQAADIVKMNEEEFRTVTALLLAGEAEEENAVKIMKQVFALELLIVTRGDRGASFFGKERLDLPGKKIVVKDAVGAGDAFSAGFLHKHLNGASLKESGEFAIELGAFVASQTGAIPDLSGFVVK